MAKRKSKAIEQTPVAAESVEAPVIEVPQSSGGSPDQERQPYVKLVDPFEFKTISAGSNTVRYGLSHSAKAYFLLFDENPNKDRQSDDPHPVIVKLRADGWKWRPTPNGVLAWKKPWANPEYSFAEDQRIRSYATAIAKDLAGPEVPGR